MKPNSETVETAETAKTNPEIAWTSPENRGPCGFCLNSEDGFAMADENGVMKAACGECVDKTRTEDKQVKRTNVGTIFTEDLDTDIEIKKREKLARKEKGRKL
jgi:hypothetical protein